MIDWQKKGMTSRNEVILGIDPGLRFSGYGVVKRNGQQAVLLDCGFLGMSSSKSLVERIGIFYDFFSDKIEQWDVKDIALETPFMGRNAQNFLKLGYLRGILYLLANKYKVTVYEFAPCEVKKTLTGFGSASKDQLARVIMQLFPRLKDPKKYDVTDALAVTLCGLWQSKKIYY